MRSFLRHLYTYLYTFWIDRKGDRELRLYSRVDKPIGELAVASIAGFEYEIQCRELKYEYSFSSPWARKKTFTVYSVSGEVTNGTAPERLQEVLSRKIVVPNLCPSGLEWEVARKYVVEAYCDIVIALLKNEIPPVHSHSVDGPVLDKSLQ